ncbi:MAG: glutathione S-transferase family protein [Silicimonas sp.]|nr:glutathione S-transferase family protein [Silicimonas sp.]
MGQLVDGNWETGDTPSKKSGKFERAETTFRNWITPDGAAGPSGDGDFPAEAGRYHLYVSNACPWAHRTLIFRALKDLDDMVSVSVVHPDLLDDGWSFETGFPGATGDTLYGLDYLREIYLKANPEISGRVTVPVLWDKDRETIVSNESAEIIRMFNSAFDGLTGNDLDFWPEDLREAMEPVNARIYNTLNNGVYRSGFARSQSAYDEAVSELFDTLDWLEDRLSSNRYLMGDRITEADWRLAVTLFRFDLVYHTHFKCNRLFVREMPAVWAYTRELYQWPGVAQTVHFDHFVRHYHYSHESVNPHRIIPINPLLDWAEPHGREALTGA